MTPQLLLPPKLRDWLSPLVHLSNNWLSLLGVVLVTASTVFWLFLLPATWKAPVEHPYLGILSYLVLPAGFFGGLAIIPLGIARRLRSERRTGRYPASFPPVDFNNVEFRRLLVFIGVTTLANIAIGSQVTYKAVNYMDGVTFCGQTCHTVMQPEFAAYQNSPHSRVNCVECHIGPGAPWFVKSKLSGVGQVFAVALDTFPRPIPAPVENLRPSRETCETCHWPQKYGEDRLRISPRFAEDEANTETKNVLLVRIGGGSGGHGIHGAHVGEGIVIRYAHSDAKRQTIPRVEASRNGAPPTVYLSPDAKQEEIQRLPVREMDCMDCHNRPTHAFEMPERALDRAIASGEISRALPYIKKKGLELLRLEYPSHEEARRAIPAALEKYYRESHPAVHGQRGKDIVQAAQSLVGIYARNVFPDMKVTWGTYPNNIGHSDFPGCFRCHDEMHTSASGKTIGQDCNSCHHLLAMDEAAPQILAELGLAGAAGR